ncbi:MAG: hypothetical protein BGN96_09240 [Bacteroidales bacterium 45-6]|nr:MAG: hypothetical protein BGN96_09240 [Bacteroidales bacterium 45-6]
MSHGKLRKEKNCLNCGQLVEERFCSHCGQENSEPRQPFYFLFTHFFEDFTHYDGQFWKTLRYLLFSPGKLTNEYLAGRRQQYVVPVKLYIFISFIVFFVPTLLPETHSDADSVKVSANGVKTMEGDSLPTLLEINSHKVYSKESYDSMANTSGKFIYKLARPVVHKYYDLRNRGDDVHEIGEKFTESFVHILPKALFVYLPLFAFLLWLFHNKKEWWFFDHGIFTLHFFSFLLLFIFLMRLLAYVADWIDASVVSSIVNLFLFVSSFYTIFYFFKAHRRVYQVRKSVTLLKGIVLFAINLFLLTFLLIVLLFFNFLTLH